MSPAATWHEASPAARTTRSVPVGQSPADRFFDPTPKFFASYQSPMSSYFEPSFFGPQASTHGAGAPAAAKSAAESTPKAAAPFAAATKATSTAATTTAAAATPAAAATTTAAATATPEASMNHQAPCFVPWAAPVAAWPGNILPPGGPAMTIGVPAGAGAWHPAAVPASMGTLPTGLLVMGPAPPLPQPVPPQPMPLPVGRGKGGKAAAEGPGAAAVSGGRGQGRGPAPPSPSEAAEGEKPPVPTAIFVDLSCVREKRVASSSVRDAPTN